MNIQERSPEISIQKYQEGISQMGWKKFPEYQEKSLLEVISKVYEKDSTNPLEGIP